MVAGITKKDIAQNATDRVFITCAACGTSIFANELGAILKDEFGDKEQYYHKNIVCLIRLSDVLKERSECACMLDGVKNPLMKHHSRYECRNDEGSILKA